MLSMEDIRANAEIMDCLNLEMTPEKAVSLYLEWGSSWAHGPDFVRSASDVSCYFTIDAWKSPARLLLVRQSPAAAEVVGEVEVPADLLKRELDSWGGRRGTYGISEEVKNWFRKKLGLD